MKIFIFSASYVIEICAYKLEQLLYNKIVFWKLINTYSVRFCLQCSNAWTGHRLFYAKTPDSKQELGDIVRSYGVS